MFDVSFSVVILYTLVLGLVAPYITVHSEKYGALVPPTIALVTGSAIWVLLTWLGFSYADGWTWIIVMIAMPIVMMFVASRLAKSRDKAFAKQLESLKK
jgi:lipopolysaccharide export LptBFGC system permease protein LptF